MRSSSEKHRDIARSILPSKNRRTSRDALNRARRRNRREISEQLRGLARALDRNPDGWLDHLGDPTATNDAQIRQLMYRRRAADKLNHFERWAVMSTRHLPHDQRLPSIKATLPDGLIGRHALSHLEFIPFISNQPRYYWHFSWAISVAEARERQRRLHCQLRAGLADALDFGDHAELNRALRRHAEARGVAHQPIRAPSDIERVIEELGPIRNHVAHRDNVQRLVSVLDEVVPDWRRLLPIDGPEPTAEGRDGWQQSSAAGLSWLERTDRFE